MTNRFLKTCAVAALVIGISVPALAGEEGGFCSTQNLAGRWLFFTEVGQQSLGLGGDGDITALGTMNIDKEGNLSGTFDVTVADLFSFPNIGYGGTVTVDPDCIGTLEFETDLGSTRTDRIAVLGKDEFRGMSLDPFSLWTYWARRIPGQPSE